MLTVLTCRLQEFAVACEGTNKAFREFARTFRGVVMKRRSPAQRVGRGPRGRSRVIKAALASRGVVVS